jgi:hypothetical protein
MQKHLKTQRTAMIEVISFLFFTLFAMIVAFFTSARVFATPVELGSAGGRSNAVGVVQPAPDADVAPRSLSF